MEVSIFPNRVLETYRSSESIWKCKIDTVCRGQASRKKCDSRSAPRRSERTERERYVSLSLSLERQSERFSASQTSFFLRCVARGTHYTDVWIKKTPLRMPARMMAVPQHKTNTRNATAPLACSAPARRRPSNYAPLEQAPVSYARLFETAPVAMALVDSDGVVAACNALFAASAGAVSSRSGTTGERLETVVARALRRTGCERPARPQRWNNVLIFFEKVWSRDWRREGTMDGSVFCRL